MPLVLTGAGAITGLTSVPTSGLQLADGNMPAGSVLQVVSATYSTVVSTTSTSFVTTNLTASITPTSSSSKILILVSLPMYVASASYSGTMTVFRGTVSGTNLGDATWGFANIFNGAASSQSCNYLDSPATTSSTTYTVAIKTENAAATVYSSPNGQKSTITLMEIAA